MKILIGFIYTFIQCSWGLLQSLVGLVLFIKNINNKHFLYHHAIVSEWDSEGSISLGLFIFMSKKYLKTMEKQPSNTQIIEYRKILAHEYGHTIQSLVLGPLYLLIIGVPSYLWGNLKYFKSKRITEHLPYSACYTESWANIWGELFTKEKTIDW